MKIQILSDLHIEYSIFDIPNIKADVLILAGDIGIGSSVVSYIKKYRNNYKEIIYVAGNHEYYGGNISIVSKEIADFCSENDIKFLDNNYFIFEDCVFIGSTLWTDFRLYGEELEKIGFYMNRAKNGINDFNLIRYAGMFFSPSHCATLSLNSQKYIKNQLETFKDLKKIVVTHHAPSVKSVHEKYLGNILNPCFANELNELVSCSNFWIHGHVHDSFDYHIENCRVIANPRGYSKNGEVENKSFNPYFILEC